MSATEFDAVEFITGSAAKWCHLGARVMTMKPNNLSSEPISVVLVHGAFVDASGWRKVYEILSLDGYEVLVVQNSAVTFGKDVERTKSIIAEAAHPVVLVGHSYGGAVITEAGTDKRFGASFIWQLSFRILGIRIRLGLARGSRCGESPTSSAERWLHQN